ncbi:hypothetical protein PHJA_002921200 [Phtheirospermum japonicum]|uniref:Vacuolar protein sorting-associated protein 62 n=1 Tax=Phtheirospermum japonicum TaxID=374723 RepID=A0A830DQ09_9LAMI|nr:hypothetical protein PHJA_002921200 [Phtheirospermum japonicum]
MGNKFNFSFKISNIFKKKNKPLPIENLFTLPSPLHTWPAGEGFASGIIDLGGLQICQVSKFTRVWATQEGGPDNRGATFFEPSTIPDGFVMLGCYSQPNNKPLSGWVLVAKDATSGPSGRALSPPTDYTLVWSSENLKTKQDGVGYIWLPTAPDGYKPVGLVVTGSPEKPGIDKIRCVRLDFMDLNENEGWIWGPGKAVNSNGINIYSARPRNRGIEAAGVITGTFVVRNDGIDLDLPCLKSLNGNKNAMPNADQIEAIVRAYSPLVYFHPDEQYFPSSVQWYFENGALLYKKGDESNPVRVDPTGSNLPQGGENDDAYWIDLPMDNAAKERVKKGDLSDACGYLHVKPMFGGTFSDVAIWLFYPFNGLARAKVEFFNVPLGKIGEHVGDWEHVTLRISNFNGQLKSMYFSQHSKGIWVDASQLEFGSGNKPVAFSSLHGHAMYPKAGLELQGNGNIGIRNDSEKGKFMDVGSKFIVVDAGYLGSVYEEPAWLNYQRKWGPKIRYSTEDEMKKVEKVLPGKLKSAFEKFVRALPNEVFGEEGPTGPKFKDSWNGDER